LKQRFQFNVFSGQAGIRGLQILLYGMLVEGRVE